MSFTADTSGAIKSLKGLSKDVSISLSGLLYWQMFLWAKHVQKMMTAGPKMSLGKQKQAYQSNVSTDIRGLFASGKRKDVLADLAQIKADKNRNRDGYVYRRAKGGMVYRVNPNDVLLSKDEVETVYKAAKANGYVNSSRQFRLNYGNTKRFALQAHVNAVARNELKRVGVTKGLWMASIAYLRNNARISAPDTFDVEGGITFGAVPSWIMRHASGNRPVDTVNVANATGSIAVKVSGKAVRIDSSAFDWAEARRQKDINTWARKRLQKATVKHSAK